MTLKVSPYRVIPPQEHRSKFRSNLEPAVTAGTGSGGGDLTDPVKLAIADSFAPKLIATGNGVDSSFNLPSTPTSVSGVFVVVDGATQLQTVDYNYYDSPDRVVFTDTPPVDTQIVVYYSDLG